MFLHEGFEQIAAIGCQGLLFHEDFSQRPGLGRDPGMHRRHEGLAANEIHLYGEDAEEQVAVVVVRGHGVLTSGVRESASLGH